MASTLNHPLQSHLYSSFLEGQTADIALNVYGHRWQASYFLHRVVLIQAGFFKSLFTAGFSEASKDGGSQASTSSRPDGVTIRLDDPHISQAAFELCLARLYGGGPSLWMDPILLPTTDQPLTPAFSIAPSTNNISQPVDTHKCTPRFLLSVLVAASYLSVSSIATEILNLILSSLGPQTVIRYLNFALGHGTGNDDDELAQVLGLERIARPLSPATTTLLEPPPSEYASSVYEDASSTFDSRSVFQDDRSTISHSTIKQANSIESAGPAYYYGSFSDRIGEAAACWLAKWGLAILEHEENDDVQSSQSQTSVSASRFPRIWRSGGLTSQWLRALLSSDVLFVIDELSRYDMARRIYELRGGPSSQSDGEQWSLLFARGIYYIHMPFEDLKRIGEDRSLTTGQAYVPEAVIHQAHWQQSLLRHHVLHRLANSPSSPTPASPLRSSTFTLDNMKELGISTAGSNIVGSNSTLLDQRRYYAVTVDASIRLGETRRITDSWMELAFDEPSKTIRTATAQSFFGIQSNQRENYSLVNSPVSTTWTTFPPCRFGVEFWEVDSLPEKSRLHSQTVWYAGSLFNIYVQRSDVRLGVYLHRQSSVEPPPPMSVPPTPAQGNEIPAHTRNRSYAYASSPIPQMITSPIGGTRPRSSSFRSSTPVSPTTRPQSPGAAHAQAGPTGSPATSACIPPTQIYRDPRSSISAYFAISCASCSGASLTSFSSAPDVFSVGQSWGWKSSTLLTDEYLQARKPSSDTPGVEGSLRATVMLGLI